MMQICITKGMRNMERLKKIAADFAAYLRGLPWTAILAVLCLVAWVGLACVLLRGCKSETVTQETQQEAETPAGVEQAAEAAKVPLSQEQAKQAAKEIRYIYQHDTKPVYTVVTTAGKAQSAAETARKAAGADFSIITDKSDPTAKTDVTKLPGGSTVELNQYNVQAYKKVLHTIEVAPDLDNGGRGVSEIGYTVQRKVTKDGKYLGVGASYNVDEHKVYAKVTYTW